MKPLLVLILLQAVFPAFSLPDLVLDYEEMRDTLTLETRGFSADNCELDPDHRCIDSPGTHTLLRFSQVVVNIGDEDLVLPEPPSGGAPDPNDFYQYSSCHSHYHWENFMRFTLLDPEDNEVAGHKASWCVLDVIRGHRYYNDSLPWYDEDAVSQSNVYRCSNMGLSVGWGDRYSIHSPCQYIQMDVPAGEYNLKLEINWNDPDNPQRHVEEMNYDNNEVVYPITLYCAEFQYSPSTSGYVDPSGHTLVSDLGSDGSFQLSLPGFRWFCHDHDNLFIHANGFVSFDDAIDTTGFSTKGDALLPNSFAVLYSNWSATGGGAVYYDLTGDSGSRSRTITISWVNVSNGVDTATFQIQFDEANERAYTHYLAVPDNFTSYKTGTCSSFYPPDCTENGFALTPGSEWKWSRVPSLNSSTRPVADVGGPYEGDKGEEILFDGSGSYDPNNEPLTYIWTFGDEEGVPLFGETVSYAYRNCGSYIVQLSVQDGFHQSEVSTTTACICDGCDDTASSLSSTAGIPSLIDQLI